MKKDTLLYSLFIIFGAANYYYLGKGLDGSVTKSVIVFVLATIIIMIGVIGLLGSIKNEKINNTRN